MPVSSATLSASGDSASDPAVSGSVNPAGWPILVFTVVTSATTGASTLSITSAGGGTISQIATTKQDAATARAIFVHYGTGVGSGALTFDADQAATNYVWTVFKLIGAAPYSIQNGAATMETDWDLVDTVTATLGTAVKATSKVFAAAFFNATTTGSLTPGSGLTNIEEHTGTSPSVCLNTSWTAGAPQTANSYTETSGDNAVGAVACAEVPALKTMMLCGVG